MPRLAISLNAFIVSIFCCTLAAKKEVPEWVILGGTCNFSYAMVCHLAAQNIPCTVIVHPRDLHSTRLYFPDAPTITIVEANYISPERQTDLDKLAAGAKYLFFDPEDKNYRTWHTTVPAIAHNALAMARKNNLTVFYPAHVYALTKEEQLTDESPYGPSTSQGMTVAKIEFLLDAAAKTKKCKVRKIRAPYAFGPAVYDYLLSSSFRDIPVNGRFTWLLRTDLPHQFCFTFDVARIATLLASTFPNEQMLTVHFSGYQYDSVDTFAAQICALAGKPLKHRTVSKFLLEVVCFAEHNAERGADLKAYFDAPVYLSDSPRLKELNFQATPIQEALQLTLDWFKNFPETRGLVNRLQLT